AGEMTASRRMERAPRSSGPRSGVGRAGLKNLLFLEWFNDRQQRVVIQSWHWNLRVSAPVWSQTVEQEHIRIKRSRNLRKKFLLERPRRPSADPAFQQPAADDPFASISPVGNPFESPLSDARPGAPLSRDSKDPFSSAALSAQIASRALAAELCDLETHLGVVPRVKAREALLNCARLSSKSPRPNRIAGLRWQQTWSNRFPFSPPPAPPVTLSLKKEISATPAGGTTPAPGSLPSSFKVRPCSNCCAQTEVIFRKREWQPTRHARPVLRFR
ncbi:MAG: hypothetical protein K8R87_06165, partial [Verrucomicrobia bacterium]|nr:hypothetical protein [Verrucomicrobiota bacterium]